MSASAYTKKQCVTCNKNNGVLICDGCQQIFCGKHVIEHRQNLAGQLDGIMQEHDLLQNEIEQISVGHVSLKKIDQWEKESITKIRLAAETARKTLQTTLDHSKERLSKACRDTAVNLRSSREADDYSENELNRWMEQSKSFKSKVTSSSSVKIIQDKQSVIHSIKIKSGESNITKSKCNDQQPSLLTNSSNLKIPEKFLCVAGPVTLENESYLAKHTGWTGTYGYIRGSLFYSHGQHAIRFKLEKCYLPYHIFFGCMSAEGNFEQDMFGSTGVVGWFGYDQVYEHGRCSTNSKKYNYNSSLIQAKDVLCITFDCDKKQIKFFNERTEKLSTLSVNIDKTPYPWRLLMVMFHEGDCVRILTDI